jgi:FkbM family methyltransferase
MNTPIRRGKYRAFLAARSICKTFPGNLIGTARDGRQFSIDLSSGMQDTVYFLGEYEPAITALIEPIIAKNGCRTFVDAGANFGWYTTLFFKYAREAGSVHAFEPLPVTFACLERNHELMGSPQNVQINNLALGAEYAEMTINVFPGEPTGHASLSDHQRTDAEKFQCRVVTLDSYIEQNNIGAVDFVKVDVEGAEMSLLRGADRLFEQDVRPIWIIEMALNQTRNFGYTPNDLVEYFKQQGEYNFFKIDEAAMQLEEIMGFDEDDIGANVLCIPTGRAV